MSAQSDLAETGRLEAFSDGVFAIAVVADAAARVAAVRGVPDQLRDPGIMWVNHRSMFRQIKRADRGLMFLNLLLLLWATLLPFPTSLFAEHLEDESSNAHVAAAVYSTNQTLAAFAFSLIWWYVLRNHLVDHTCRRRRSASR
ncbi:TMEM175 family protein [Kribbella speibonae]|uniref:TMEM175 family protein n=1 Tax=Kribbella speibonae TaxID=1572660 RepID=UPI0013F3B535|nr:TMEM175 family protein [Kribbella speibonae]